MIHPGYPEVRERPDRCASSGSRDRSFVEASAESADSRDAMPVRRSKTGADFLAVFDGLYPGHAMHSTATPRSLRPQAVAVRAPAWASLCQHDGVPVQAGEHRLDPDVPATDLRASNANGLTGGRIVVHLYRCAPPALPGLRPQHAQRFAALPFGFTAGPAGAAAGASSGARKRPV